MAPLRGRQVHSTFRAHRENLQYLCGSVVLEVAKWQGRAMYGCPASRDLRSGNPTIKPLSWVGGDEGDWVEGMGVE